jgi:hypothetical protein
MRASRHRVQTAVTHGAPAARKGAAPLPSPVDPAFHRAILKIALELRRPGSESYDALVDRTIRRMGLDGTAFRRYLGENGAQNMSLLLSTARRIGP